MKTARFLFIMIVTGALLVGASSEAATNSLMQALTAAAKVKAKTEKEAAAKPQTPQNGTTPSQGAGSSLARGQGGPNTGGSTASATAGTSTPTTPATGQTQGNGTTGKTASPAAGTSTPTTSVPERTRENGATGNTTQASNVRTTTSTAGNVSASGPASPASANGSNSAKSSPATKPVAAATAVNAKSAHVTTPRVSGTPSLPVAVGGGNKSPKATTVVIGGTAMGKFKNPGVIGGSMMAGKY